MNIAKLSSLTPSTLPAFSNLSCRFATAAHTATRKQRTETLQMLCERAYFRCYIQVFTTCITQSLRRRNVLRTTSTVFANITNPKPERKTLRTPIDQDIMRKSVRIRFGRSHASNALFKSFLPACTSTRLIEHFIPCFHTLALGVCAITLTVTIRIGSIEARRAYGS